MKQGAHLERFPATFCAARSSQNPESYAPSTLTFTLEKFKAIFGTC